MSPDGSINPLTNVSFEPAEGLSNDVLFADDANGQFDIHDSPFIGVDQGILEDQQHGVYKAKEDDGSTVSVNVNYYNFNYSSNSIELFEFLARNTSVEWSFITYTSGSQKKAYLGTDEGNKSNVESASFSFGLDKFLGQEVRDGSAISIIDAGHSHPAGQDFHGPSGYFPGDPVTVGDLQLIQSLQNIPQLQNIHLNYWIYDIDTGYFKYNANSNYYNSPISGPYKNYFQITNP